MIRKMLAALLVSLVTVCSASAQTCGAYPNTLTNGTNADANAVMSNFASILNCANTSLAAKSGATFTGSAFFTGGNVGIGTTTPSTRLTVDSGLAGAALAIAAGGQTGRYYTMGVNTSAALSFNDASVSAPRMVIDSSGNVGIGTATPSTRLTVDSGLAGAALAIAAGSQTGRFYTLGLNTSAALSLNDAAVGATRMLIDTSGNVGIGTTTPAFTLQVNGSVAGVGAYNNTSDGRLKKDIASLEYGLDTIMKLRPVGFNWVTQDQEWKQQHQIGLIAQEVEPVVPEVVTTAKDELQTKSLAYGGLVPILIKAVQDLKADNDNLRAAHDSEAAQIAALTARLDAIESARLRRIANGE
jgi:hypothetical protein